MCKSTRVLIFCFLFIGLMPLGALAEKRVALVIGNSAYKNISPLANPVNDAKLMAEVLKAQGFEVVFGLNLEYRAMKRAMRRYTAKLRGYGRDTIGFIFYAGHGLQVGGTNYLVPVRAEIESEGDVDIEAVSASSLMFGVRQARNRLNIIVLDACRNNPYRSMFRSTNRGLRQMNAPMGSLIAFSTSPGDVAADGVGKNSPFTTALAQSMRIPGLTIERIFKTTRRKVYDSSKKRQLPWINSSLLGEFYPAGLKKKMKPKPAPPAKLPSAPAKELAFWQAAKDQGSRQAYDVYTKKFPKGFFTPLAQMKLDEFKRIDEIRTKQRGELEAALNKHSEAMASLRKVEATKRQAELDDLIKEQRVERERLAKERDNLVKRLKEMEKTAKINAKADSEKLEKARDGKIVIASLPVATAEKTQKADIAMSRKELATAAQKYLKRVGCYNSRIDGDWGAGSRRAMTNFNRHSKLKLSVDIPGIATINALEKITKRVCPKVIKAKTKPDFNKEKPLRKASNKTKKKRNSGSKTCSFMVCLDRCTQTDGAAGSYCAARCSADACWY